MSPKLEGTCPTGVTMQDECICVQLGSSHGGDSLTFFSVSGGVGEAAGPLIGSPEAVAGTSGSSTDGATGFYGDVAGLLSSMEDSCGLHHAQCSGPFLQDSQPWCGPSKDGSIGEGGKRPYGPSQLMNASCQKALFIRLRWVGLFCSIL